MNADSYLNTVYQIFSMLDELQKIVMLAEKDFSVDFSGTKIKAPVDKIRELGKRYDDLKVGILSKVNSLPSSSNLGVPA